MDKKGRKVNVVNILLLLLLSGFIYLCFNPVKFYAARDAATELIGQSIDLYDATVSDTLVITSTLDDVVQEDIVNLKLEDIKKLVTTETKIGSNGYTWVKLNKQ